jgi:hypothetical protein
MRSHGLVVRTQVACGTHWFEWGLELDADFEILVFLVAQGSEGQKKLARQVPPVPSACAFTPAQQNRVEGSPLQDNEADAMDFDTVDDEDGKFSSHDDRLPLEESPTMSRHLSSK